MQDRICPNCRFANPAHFTICRECGARLIANAPASGSPKQRTVTSTDLPMFPVGETVGDWLRVYWSLGFNLGRIKADDWGKFLVDLLGLAIVNGLVGLAVIVIAVTLDSPLGTIFDDISITPDIEESIAVFVYGVMSGLGLAIINMLYIIVTYGVARFLGGDGDVLPHLHLSFSADIARGLVVPLVILAGLIDLWVFLAVGFVWLAYGYYLNTRVVQIVHEMSLPLALVVVVVGPGLASFILGFVL